MQYGLLLIVAVAAITSQAAERPTLGFITEFPDDVSQEVRDEFRMETERILQVAGVDLAWRSPNQAGSRDSFSRMVVMSFRSGCTPALTTARRGGTALGVTSVTGGRVLPFVELDCHRVQESAEMGGCQTRSLRCAAILGRALARVAAHEMFHVLTASRAHAKSGLMKAAFDRQDLRGPELSFSRESIGRLRISLGTETAQAALRAAPATDH